MGTPPFRDEVDIGEWDGREPEELLTDPALVEWVTKGAEAAYALTYAHHGSSDRYDEIGFRVMAATLGRGEVPLKTRVSARRTLAARRWAARDPESAKAVEEQENLRHRPIEPPDGQLRYTTDYKRLNLIRELEDSAGRPYEETWTFPLMAPGRWLLDLARDDDAPLAVSQQLATQTVRGFWLPLRRLIDAGRFERMQDCREHLVSEIAANRLYVFLSHRWLAAAEPDPDALQARLVAWQLVANLCEAIGVAARRGLHVPRKYSHRFGVAVGIAGSDLAETMLVNVLRPTLSLDGLHAATAEIETLEDRLADDGVESALDDPGLDELARIVNERRELAALVDRLHLWYDYSCLPQPPRSRDEDALFEDGLSLVRAFQVTDTTAIVLGDADDHLSRAWCTLEALTAGSFRRSNLLVGSARPATMAGQAEIAFKLLLSDQPHIVWRAVLDTEVFAIQQPATCMTRLGLAMTDERDLPFVYACMRDLGAPEGIHRDSSEILTGTLPLAVLPGTQMVLVPSAVGGGHVEAREWRSRASLDWRGALHVGESWSARTNAADVPPFVECETASGGYWRASCHVAIVAACEGEAVLFASWVLRRRRELEQVIDASIASLSWLACDIAPVGHFAYGALTARAIDPPLWVIVSTGSRLTGCAVTMTVGETMAMAGLRRITIDLTASVDNVAFLDRATHDEVKAALQDGRFARTTTDHDFVVHRGGMFQWGIAEDRL